MSATDALHVAGLDLLQLQTRELDALISLLDPEDGEDATASVLSMMLQALGVSLHSVIKLTATRDMAIRDCFGIARTAAETAVNLAFIAAGGTPLAEKAIRHMRQKRWRDLKRTGQFSGTVMSISRDIGARASEFDGLQAALDEYTNKRGGEVRDWTPENIEQRIELVAQRSRRAGTLLSAAIFTIYRPSSELLHGTFYGVNYFWQGSRELPVKTPATFDDLWTTEHFVTLLSTLIFASSGAIEAVAAVRQLPEPLAREGKVMELVARWSERATALDPEAAPHQTGG